MIDYYPVISRTVSRLEDNSAPARVELYRHARAILAAQLRKLDPPRSASEIKNELIALESAIRRVEAEALSPRPQPPMGAAPALPQLNRTGVTAARSDIGFRHERATAAGEKGTLGTSTAEPKEGLAARALTERESETAPARLTEAKAATATIRQPEKAAWEKAFAEAQVRPEPAVLLKKIDTSKKPAASAIDDMRGMPASLGAMLIGITFVVGATAFVGVVYVRGLVLVSANVIGYPFLLVVSSALSGLFVLLAVAIFRKARIVSAIDFLLKLTYSALPREL